MQNSHVDWYNLNETRDYPFLPADHASAEYRRLIVDLVLMVTPEFVQGSPYPGFTLGQFRVEGGSPDNGYADATLFFSLLYTNGALHAQMATGAPYRGSSGMMRHAHITVGDTSGYRSIELLGHSMNCTLSGRVVFGDIAAVIRERMAAGNRVTDFSPRRHGIDAVTRVDPRAIRVFIPPPLPYLRGTLNSPGLVLGDVQVVGGINADVQTTGPGVITISPDASTVGNLAPVWRPGGSSIGAHHRDAEFQGRVERSGYSGGVRAINGVPADSSGRITLEFR